MENAYAMWERRKGEIKDAIKAEGITDEAAVERIFSRVEDIVDEVRWEAKEDGRFDESFYHVCSPDW